MGMPFLSVIKYFDKFSSKICFPLLTVKTQSPARTNFLAFVNPEALLPLLMVLSGYMATKTSQLPEGKVVESFKE